MAEQSNDGSKRASTGVLIAIGVVTGVLAGLLGVGGGIIMVPALVAVGFNRHRATASSLAAILLIAVAGAIAFGAAGDVDIPTGVFLGLGGLLGSTVGAHWMNRLSGRTLARIFGVVLLVAGIRMTIGGGVEGGFEPAPVMSFALELLIGALTGILSGLAGIGGGIVMIPAMVLLLGIDQHTAEGTSLVAMLFTAAAGTRVNVANHHVDWRAMWILGAAGAIVAPLSAVAAQQIPADTLGRIFGVFVIVNAVRTLWKSRAAPN
ncbi:MAG TPA: sulfite exporter TauE/SafE family protein [Acidimicrobiia bacterium]|nr:sulfite exporter TauE/SafE family protein [Acidimicrobiia bacterium]